MARAWERMFNRSAKEPDGTFAPVLEGGAPESMSDLLASLTAPVWKSADEWRELILGVITADSSVAPLVLSDLEVINERNLEDNGVLGTWIGSRGFHALLAHRVIHSMWCSGKQSLALALKSSLYSLGCDIHPAACFGSRIFLDHAIGVVVGETAVVGDEVSLWHGVTLGSTLMEEGDRHPKVRNGAVIGAGAILLGNIIIGEGAIVASGSVVLKDVRPYTTVAGHPAAEKRHYSHPFGLACE